MHIYESDSDVIRSTFLNMYVFKSLINAMAYYYFALDIIILIPLRYIAHVRSSSYKYMCNVDINKLWAVIPVWLTQHFD